MTDEQRRTGSGPEPTPAEQDVTGTGAPRSAGGGTSQPQATGGEPADEAELGGMTSTAQPASGDELTINRSGSGGTGGPVEPDESVEGSSGQSLSELLGGEDETGRPTG